MGLDTNLFSPAKRDNSLKDKLGIKGPFLLFVGIIVEQKGIRYLIKSMPKVIEVFPDAKLVIVGEGNLKNEMIEFADKLNVSNNLHFTGILPHDELPQYFATADLFILPSFSEGWPVVVMEALSSGTPTIVTNIPVFEKHEQKKRLFTIVPVGNSEFIAKEIIKMLTKKKILLSPQNDLRTYAKENLDWVIISNKYKNIIRICIEKK
jgi:glycosyltransferase involved in cell wall biosynthesis